MEAKTYHVETELDGKREKFRVRASCLHSAGKKGMKEAFRRLPQDNYIYHAQQLDITVRRIED
mgnify:CR=1